MPEIFKTEDEGEEIDIFNSDHLTQPRLNGYIKYITEVYSNANMMDEVLPENYQYDFASWTEFIFDIADKIALNYLRDHLRRNGVYLHLRAGYRISRALAMVLKYEELPEWPGYEIKEMMVTGEFNSKFNPDRQQSPTIDSEYTIKGKEIAQIGSVASTLPSNPSPEESKDEILEVAGESFELNYILEGFDPVNLVTFARLYKDDMKYSGTDDNFDLKLQLFFDNFRRSGIAPTELNLVLAFSAILKDKASRYWLESLDNKGYSLSEMIEVLRCHFNTSER